MHDNELDVMWDVIASIAQEVGLQMVCEQFHVCFLHLCNAYGWCVAIVLSKNRVKNLIKIIIIIPTHVWPFTLDDFDTKVHNFKGGANKRK
jgi:hypothetical protein